MVKNFRFEEEGAIALSGFPETPEAVDWLHDRGIRAVVSLHPVPQEVEARLRERVAWRPFLVGDFAAGVPAGIGEVFRFLDHHTREEPAALIH